MKRSRLLRLAASVVFLLTTSRVSAAEPLTGSWALVSAEVKRADGGASSSPLGEGTVGLLIYDPSGQVSLQIMRPGRPAFASGDRLQGTDVEVRAAFEGYLAYYGTFEIDEAKGTISHRLTGSSFPNWIGTTQVRHYRLQGDRLSLTSNSGQAGGAPIVATFVWQRVR